MPMTDQDARALTYLARRLRDETPGARAWDEAGTYAAVAKLIGQNLASAAERVTRHAADPNAKTPGAIARPFVPDHQPGKWHPTAGPWCGICGKPQQHHPASDHAFEVIRGRDERKLPADQVHDLVTELRGHLEPVAPPPPPREHKPDPRAAEARAEMEHSQEGAA